MKKPIVVALVGVAIAVGCFEHTYFKQGVCDEQVLCPDGAFCLYGTCISADGFMPPDGFVPPDGFQLCMTSDECDDSRPICAAGVCRKCTSSLDNDQCVAHKPNTPRCDVPSGRCVQCVKSEDCTDPTTPICTGEFICRKCAKHDECASGVCTMDGSCAIPNQIAVVNNAVTCDDVLGKPYCQIQPAVLSKTPYILVKGSATAYNAVTLAAATDNVTVTIIGPGRSASPLASVAGSGTAAVSVSVATAGRRADVVLDGLDLVGSNGIMKNVGVDCNVSGGTANLTVKNSSIHDSGLVGLRNTSCNVIIDANVIGPANGGGGITLATTPSYVITNNLIGANGQNGRGVTIDDASSGTFAFNTVAGNLYPAGLGGVDCGGGAPKTLSYSIIVGNSGASQVGAQCSLQQSVTGGAAGTPTFVSTTDFHLKKDDPANLACCVDKVAAPMTSGSDHDVDAVGRPIGGGWDVGADEAQ
jgi:hypothetical protein